MRYASSDSTIRNGSWRALRRMGSAICGATTRDAIAIGLDSTEPGHHERHERHERRAYPGGGRPGRWLTKGGMKDPGLGPRRNLGTQALRATRTPRFRRIEVRWNNSLPSWARAAATLLGHRTRFRQARLSRTSTRCFRQHLPPTVGDHSSGTGRKQGTADRSAGFPTLRQGE
jgi:hypothetical protein